MLEVSPGEGTITVTEPTSGGQDVCSEDCSLTFPRGTRVNLEFRSDRPGNPNTSRRVALGTDLRVRGEWQDRSGYRIGGGALVLGGLAAAAAIIGGGVTLMGSSSSTSYVDGLAHGLGAIVIGIGGAVGLAASIIGAILLGMEDRPILLQERLRSPVTLWAAPIDDGAMLGLGGEL